MKLPLTAGLIALFFLPVLGGPGLTATATTSWHEVPLNPDLIKAGDSGHALMSALRRCNVDASVAIRRSFARWWSPSFRLRDPMAARSESAVRGRGSE